MTNTVTVYDGVPMTVPVSAFADPQDFFNSAEATPIINRLAVNANFCAYSGSGDRPLSLKEAARFAHTILDALKRGRDATAALAASFTTSFNGDAAEEVVEPITNWFMSALREATADAAEGVSPAIDDDFEELLRDAVVDRAIAIDTSTPLDAFSKFDKAEVVFIFGDDMGNIDTPIDRMLACAGSWADPARMIINRDFQRALAPLGWSATRYRRVFKDIEAPIERLASLRPRREALVSEKDLASIIENACTNHFFLVAYAQVGIPDLARLDLKKPLRFSKAAIGSYNPFDGTFFDAVSVNNLVVRPSDGVLHDCHGWYGPDDICGLVGSYYAASLANA
jgi:hypothetical protein